MRTTLRDDLQRLAYLAYHRSAWGEEVIRELHRLRSTARQHPDLPALEQVCAWLFVPFALWAIDFHRLTLVVQEQIRSGARLESELRFLIDSLRSLPSQKAQAAANAHEHRVQRGDYAAQVRAGDKYLLMEEKLMSDPHFQAEWASLKAQFDVTTRANGQGVIRRRVVAERGFRPGWELDWPNPAARFRRSSIFFASAGICVAWSTTDLC